MSTRIHCVVGDEQNPQRFHIQINASDGLHVEDIKQKIAIELCVPLALIRLFLPDEIQLTDDILHSGGGCSKLLSSFRKRMPLRVRLVPNVREGAEISNSDDIESNFSESDIESSPIDSDNSDTDGSDNDKSETGNDNAITDPETLWRTLGAAFHQARPAGLDGRSLDLCMFRPIYHAKRIRKAMCLLYRHFTSDPSECVLLKDILVQPHERSDLVVNTIAGYVQIGKTRIGACAAYLLCYMCSLVPCIFVRSQGGADSMDNFRATISDIAEEAITFLTSQINAGMIDLQLHELRFFRPSVMETRDFVDTDISDVRFGERANGLMIIGRQNASTIVRLFGETQRTRNTPVHRRSLAELIRGSAVMNFGNTMKRYALIFDEDDAAQGSAGRDKTKTDIANYCQKMPIQKLMLRLSASRNATISRELSEDDGDTESEPEQEADPETESSSRSEPDVSYQQLITTDTVRATAACVLQMSASWLTNEIYASEKYRQKTRVLQVPVPENYVGFWPNAENRRAVVIKTIPSALPTPRKVKVPSLPKKQRLSAAKYSIACGKYERDLSAFERYVELRSVYDQCRPWYKHEAGLRQMFAHCFEAYSIPQTSHISIHINTQATTYNANQRSLADTILSEFGARVPIIVFAYNQDSGKLVLLMSKHENWSRNTGQAVTSDHLKGMIAGTSLSHANDVILKDEEQLTEVLEFDHCFHVGLKCNKLRIQRAYSIIYGVFESLHTKPFVVSITGALGGRAFTMKTTDHRYPLTDQFFDAAVRTHMERLLQYTGRICSKDSLVGLERRCWMSKHWKNELYLAIELYAEVASLFHRHPDSELSDLLKSISERQYPALYKYAHNSNGVEISRPAVINPVKHKIKKIARTASEVNVQVTQLEAVLAALNWLREASALTIVDYLESSHNAIPYRTHEELKDMHIRNTSFVFQITSGQSIRDAMRGRVQKALQVLKQDSGRIGRRIHEHVKGASARGKIYRLGTRDACDICNS